MAVNIGTVIALANGIVNKVALEGVDLSNYQEKTDETLTTEAKTIVGSINEVSSSLEHITQNQGDLINLQTTNKNDLVQAINEVFQDVSNGKTLIASAITDKGVATSNTDSFQTMATNISLVEVKNTPTYKIINGNLHREILNEDFEGEGLNKNIWVDRYLTTWTDKEYLSKADYKIENSILTLKIENDSNSWNPTNDGDLRVSGIQSGELDGLHKQTPVYRHIDKFLGFIAQYGYFELKAKTFIGEGQHCAWWMIGLQDKSLQKYEIDIFEILGVTPNTIQTVGHPNGGIENSIPVYYHVAPSNLNEDYHTYGFEWTDTEMIFYFDGTEYYRYDVSIIYPLITVLSCYESRSGNWTGAVDTRVPYPKEFKIDYLKVYKRATSVQTKDTLSIVSIGEINVSGVKTLNSVTGILDELPSYCYVNWSDGSRTEHWVKWKPCTPQYSTNLSGGVGFTWEGCIVDLGKIINANILEGVIALTGISIPTTLNITKGTTKELALTYAPTNTTQRGITWTSTDELVATVNNGTVTAIKDGTCTIKATSSVNPSLSASCTVTVETTTISVQSITLDKSTATINSGEATTLNVTFSPLNATNKTITWTSNNEAVATVNNGTVTGKGKGSCIITATSVDGSKIATCTVTVIVDTGLIVDLNSTTTQTTSLWADGSGKGNDFEFNAWGSSSGFSNNALVFDGVAGTLKKDMASLDKATLTLVIDCKFDNVGYVENYILCFPRWDDGIILGNKDSRFWLMGYSISNLDLGVSDTNRNKFVITTNSTETKVYINGVLKGTTKPINIRSQSNSCFCILGENSLYKFKGTLYGFKMYNKVLTQEEINTL